MREKMMELAGRRRMLLALIMATFALGLLFSGWFTPTPGLAQQGTGNPQPNIETTRCVVVSKTTNCVSAGSISLVAPTNSPVVCLGSGITLAASYLKTNGQFLVITTYTNTGNSGAAACPPITNTISATPPSVVTNWWEASVGSFRASGSGLSALFTPTNCGSGTVIYHLNYQNSLPCNTNIQSAVDVSGSFQVDTVTALTPSAGDWVDDGDGDLNTDVFLVQYGCYNTITITASDCLGLSPADLPACWQMSGGTVIDRKNHSVDGYTVGKTVVNVSCGTSSKTVTIIVYKATYEADSANGTLAAWWGHAWWDLSVTPSLNDFLTHNEQTSQGSAGWYNSGDAQNHGMIEWGGQYIGGTSSTYVATATYWWCISFKHYVHALLYVDLLANGATIFSDCSNNCTVQTEQVASAAGVPLNYSDTPCLYPGGLTAYLNTLVIPSPCLCQQ